MGLAVQIDQPFGDVFTGGVDDSVGTDVQRPGELVGDDVDDHHMPDTAQFEPDRGAEPDRSGPEHDRGVAGAGGRAVDGMHGEAIGSLRAATANGTWAGIVCRVWPRAASSDPGRGYRPDRCRPGRAGRARIAGHRPGATDPR